MEPEVPTELPVEAPVESPVLHPVVQYAAIWRRALALTIDSVLVGVACVGAEYLVLRLFYKIMIKKRQALGEGVPPFDQAFDPFQLQIFETGLFICLAFPYFVWLHYRYGQTLGKKLLRIQVRAANAVDRITLFRAFLRFFSYLPSQVFFGAGFLMALFHPKKRALHDVIAGTVVVPANRE